MVWKGHPGGLKKDVISKALEGSISTPLWDWPDSMKAAKKAVASGRLGTALLFARKIAKKDSDAKDYVEVLESAANSLVEGFEKSFQDGDYLRIKEDGKALKSGFKGLPQEEKIVEILTAFSKTKGTAKIISKQKTLGKLKRKGIEARKKKDLDKCIEKIEKLKAKNAGNFVEQSATRVIESLNERRKKLRR